MSGHATIDTAVEATRIGAQAFLEKPITLQKLLKAVESGLARKPAASPVVTTRAHLVPPTLAEPAASIMTMTGPVPVEMPAHHQSFDLDVPLREARDAFEKAYFEFHLAKENESMTRVAEKTGLERTHLYRKLKQLGVDLARGKRQGV